MSRVAVMLPSMILVIPARGGSKRVPRKNLRRLAGVPLVVLAVRAARAAVADLPGGVPPVYVSTEDAEIAAVAAAAGARVIARPPELATDRASTEAALLHVLDCVRDGGRDPEWVVSLQPTSPFRSASTIRHCLEVAAAAVLPVDAFLTVTETRGDFWRRSGDGAERWSRLFPDAPRRQQDREPLYEENSAVYLVRSAALRSTGRILGTRPVGVPIPQIEGFDLNTGLDFTLAEALVAADPHLLRAE